MRAPVSLWDISTICALQVTVRHFRLYQGLLFNVNLDLLLNTSIFAAGLCKLSYWEEAYVWGLNNT